MSYQAPKDETLQRLCLKSSEELSAVFRLCTGREAYSRSLKSLVRDLAEDHQLRERRTLVARLQSWIVEAQKSPSTRFLKRVKDVKLLAFGSSVMGISNRDGDLDISLEGAIRDRSVSPTGRLSDAARCFKADLLAEVHDALRRGQHFRHSKHTQLIRHAKVPVSKFVEPHTGIHCDLSIGNTTGVFKSVLLAEVLRIDVRVRDLVVIVKKWAKANRLNDPANGSFNSYCLTLLVLSFAQARSPPLIPPFRELFPGLRDVVCESQKDDHVDLIQEIASFRHSAECWMEQPRGERNTETLCELLCAFFLDLSLFATHSQLLHYTAEGVSKSNSRPTCSCWDSGFVLSAWDAKALKRYQLFVEDPFEAKDNCARTLATQDWWRIVKTLQETVHLVQEFIYAPPPLQPEKWMVLWSFLFQYEPLPQLPEPGDGLDPLLQRPKALMPLHKDCLVEHLNKFKASDKKFIAVSYSWWSKEFKQFVLTAIEGLGLFQGKGPKKKVIISKADNIKDDMVEHAVNSTLRARKTHNLVVDPYQCVMKQRLAEFLRCTIRYHKFRASYFDDETKDWLLRCVLEAGLKGKYVDGDLHLERPADLRPVTLEDSGTVPRKELPLVAGSPTDDLTVVGPFELDEPAPVTSESKLTSYALDDDDDLEEEDLWGDVNGTETCASSCGEMGTSYETSCVRRCITSSDAVRVQLNVGADGGVLLNFVVLKHSGRRSTQRSRRMEDPLEDLSSSLGLEDAIRVTLTAADDRVSLGLEPATVGTSRGLLSELTTVTEDSREDSDSGFASGPLLSNGLHERNAEILKRVFLDLFDAMEKLQDTDSFRGEIEIDPTEYVVPVSWVRQQVRDIARHLFLEIVVHNKRRRAMKIRIRKRARFEESESDDEYDYQRRSYRHDDAHKLTVENYYYDERRSNNKADIFDRFGPSRFQRNSVDDEDHVTRCLLWIKGMKREKSMHFQSGIYPPDVMASLKERAEELGLRMEVRENTMFISVHPQAHPYDEVPKVSAAKLAMLNEKVQAAIKDYFVRVMMESRSRGVESFGLPTKGYFMRPEWVAKQVIEIGKRTGFEVLKERDGTVELFASPLSGASSTPGLSRRLSVPNPLQISMPQGPSSLMVGNLSRSFSGGHFPTPQPLLASHPVSIERWQTQSTPLDVAFREARTPKTSPLETPTAGGAPFSRADFPPPPEQTPSRRSRRPQHNDRHNNVREFPKPYWENGVEGKETGYERRGRGRGKGRRGRNGRGGRHGNRAENGKKHNGGATHTR